MEINAVKKDEVYKTTIDKPSATSYIAKLKKRYILQNIWL